MGRAMHLRQKLNAHRPLLEQISGTDASSSLAWSVFGREQVQELPSGSSARMLTRPTIGKLKSALSLGREEMLAHMRGLRRSDCFGG